MRRLNRRPSALLAVKLRWNPSRFTRSWPEVADRHGSDDPLSNATLRETLRGPSCPSCFKFAFADSTRVHEVSELPGRDLLATCQLSLFQNSSSLRCVDVAVAAHRRRGRLRYKGSRVFVAPASPRAMNRTASNPSENRILKEAHLRPVTYDPSAGTSIQNHPLRSPSAKPVAWSSG